MGDGWLAGRPGLRFAVLFCHAVLVVVLLLPLLSFATMPARPATSLDLDRRQAVNLSIQADNVPLADLLRRIGEQTGVPVVLYSRADEPVSLASQGEDLASVFRTLLKDYNFVLQYRDIEAGLVNKVFVLSRKTPAGGSQTGLAPNLTMTVHRPESDLSPDPAEPNASAADGAGKFDMAPAEAVGARSSDSAKSPGLVDSTPPGSFDSRFLQMSRAVAESHQGIFIDPADRFAQSPLALDDSNGFFRRPDTGPQRYGLRLGGLAPGSPLAKFGLAEGDIIREVNGLAVQSATDLTRQLDQAIGTGDGPPIIIGIERPVWSEDSGVTITPQHIHVRLVQ